MSKKVLLGGVAVILVLSALVGGFVTKAVVNSAPCLKPNSYLLYTDVVASGQALERYIKRNVPKDYKIGKDFDYAVTPDKVEAGVISGHVTVGNGYFEFFGQPGFAGKTATYAFEVTQSCMDGPWKVVKFKREGKDVQKTGGIAVPADPK